MDKIGFRQGYMKNEAEEESSEVIIPDAVYDGNGNVITKSGLESKTRLNNLTAKSKIINAISKFILYSSIGTAILMLSYTGMKYIDNNNKKVVSERSR